ncbi:MAG TPA: glycosyltransferase family 2 protein [Mucilaginibacter sp.]|jgi:glycosyltransferase involved in cell wall biosynthesis|nr:glycosyltransferase family 2 protein [Mucilaginibacter sp.]
MVPVSFFMPAYNCSKTIEESVDSIMESNFNDGDELIIVNDFSDDGTPAVLEKLMEKYPVITVIHHKRNKGGAAARNTAVEHARHPLLFCLDSDNVLEKNSINPLKDFLIEQNADIACFQELKYFSESTGKIDEVWPYQAGVFTIEDLLSGKLTPGGNGNYLFTKVSWIKANGYTEDLGALDTWSFGFKQLIEGCRMAVMPGTYYFHRRGHESYYIRDAWKKRRSVSLRLIKLIINYIDRINPEDVDYIFSKKGRYSWFDNLSKRPIRLNKGTGGDAVWEEHEIKKGLAGTIKDKANYYKTRLSQKLGKG